jgi:hypothetical protein
MSCETLQGVAVQCVAVFDRGPRALQPGGHYRGPTTSPDAIPLVDYLVVDALASDTETLNDRAVSVDVSLHQVLQESATLPHQDEQTATTVMVVLVGLQVLRQVLDATRQHRDLYLR